MKGRIGRKGRKGLTIIVVCLAALVLGCFLAAMMSKANHIQYVFTARYVFVTQYGIFQSDDLEGLSDLPCIKVRHVFIPGAQAPSTMPWGVSNFFTCKSFEILKDGRQIWPPFDPSP